MAGLACLASRFSSPAWESKEVLDVWTVCEESTSDSSVCMVQRLWFGAATFCSEGYDKSESCDVVAHGLVREVRDVAQKLCLFATMVIPSKIESIIFLYIQITAVTYPFQIIFSSY